MVVALILQPRQWMYAEELHRSTCSFLCTAFREQATESQENDSACCNYITPARWLYAGEIHHRTCNFICIAFREQVTELHENESACGTYITAAKMAICWRST
jgi:hypothetical protein